MGLAFLLPAFEKARKANQPKVTESKIGKSITIQRKSPNPQKTTSKLEKD